MGLIVHKMEQLLYLELEITNVNKCSLKIRPRNFRSSFLLKCNQIKWIIKILLGIIETFQQHHLVFTTTHAQHWKVNWELRAGFGNPKVWYVGGSVSGDFNDDNTDSEQQFEFISVCYHIPYGLPALYNEHTVY